MEIIINGHTQTIPEGSSVYECIQLLDLADKRYAVDLNQMILPRSLYAQTMLKAGDQIEIIHAVGGG